LASQLGVLTALGLRVGLLRVSVADLFREPNPIGHFEGSFLPCPQSIHQHGIIGSFDRFKLLMIAFESS
jgi:hypothetical protein